MARFSIVFTALLVSTLVCAVALAAQPEDSLLETLGLQDQEALRNGLRTVREAVEGAVGYAKGLAGAAGDKASEVGGKTSRSAVDSTGKVAAGAKEQEL